MNKLFKVMFLGVALFVMSGIANAQVKIAHVNTAEILDAMPDKAKTAPCTHRLITTEICL